MRTNSNADAVALSSSGDALCCSNLYRAVSIVQPLPRSRDMQSRVRQLRRGAAAARGLHPGMLSLVAPGLARIPGAGSTTCIPMVCVPAAARHVNIESTVAFSRPMTSLMCEHKACAVQQASRTGIASRRPVRAFATAPTTGKQAQLAKVRNLGVIAHIDAGKTTTSERILFYARRIRSIGNVDDGDTTMDFLEEVRSPLSGLTIGMRQ